MLNGLYFYFSTFRSMCAMSNLGVFCSSLILCFPSMWLRYFLNDFEMVPVAPLIVGITSVFTFHFHCIFVARLCILDYYYYYYYYSSFIVFMTFSL